MSCLYDVTSDDYVDFIISNMINLNDISEAANIVCADQVDSFFTIIYTPRIPTDRAVIFPYAAVPNLYTLLDSSGISASGVAQTLTQSAVEANGQGVLIGFIDTGIDYLNPLFQDHSGMTRILGIWDQEIKADPADSDSVPYGTEFSSDQINAALISSHPYDIVPSIDHHGHGTFVAGIAAGSKSEILDFTGAAPACSIGVVKLKPAKQYYRDYYTIKEDVPAYQENDIMQGIRYLSGLAARYRMPLVIYIGIGTNYGGHEGSSPLGVMLRRVNQQIGVTAIVPAGNETGLSHHYQGLFTQNQEYEDVEIRVGGGENGFLVQLWASPPEIYSVGFISPLGQMIQRIPPNYETTTSLTLILEQTQIIVRYGYSEVENGSQYVLINFKNPTPGIWKIRVHNILFINGLYHMWLPVRGFISSETVFLKPNPDTVITEPGNAHSAITVGAYNHYEGSIYIHSGRGYSRGNAIKPDLVAPGVNIYGPGLPVGTIDPIRPMVRQTGTSIAAAYVAGAAANLLSWGIVNKNYLNMTSGIIKSILIRGADRSPSYQYPNREWGYGSLNLYQSFLRLMD